MAYVGTIAGRVFIIGFGALFVAGLVMGTIDGLGEWRDYLIIHRWI